MPGVSEELRNKFEITEVPFSYPGSRILIFQYPGESKLYVKLAERLINLFPGLESYLSRDPFISDLNLINESGQPLAFQVTTRPHSIVLDTSEGPFTIVFQDAETFCICLPSNRKCGIRFKVEANDGEKVGNGGKVNSYQNLYYASDAKILIHELSIKIPKINIGFSVHSDSESVIRLCVNNSCPSEKPIEKASEIIRSAENIWNGWFDRLPVVNELFREKYIYAWWVLINNLISAKGNILYDMAVPSKKGYIGAWLWDCALHSISFRHLDPELARNQIRGMLAHQLPDGMLPDAVFDDGIVSEIDHPIKGRVTKPPILAWAAMKIHQVAPDINFINEIYQPLVRWNRWWFDKNDDDHDGLVQYNHPYSSGMDDLPAWDYGFPVESPDINTYLYNQMQSLGRMANLLGKDKEAGEWQRRSISLLNLITSKLWDKKMGLFKTLKGKNPLPTKSIIGLFPIWTGGLTHAMNKSILDHLDSPVEFGGEYILPVVSRDDKDFDPDKMWRGPIWANINYFMVEALTQIGETERANHLRKETLDLIMKNKGIYEYYNAATGEPGKYAMPVFSWTAAIFIDLAIQASAKKEE